VLQQSWNLIQRLVMEKFAKKKKNPKQETIFFNNVCGKFLSTYATDGGNGNSM
jgi:hypothetical protein